MRFALISLGCASALVPLSSVTTRTTTVLRRAASSPADGASCRDDDAPARDRRSVLHRAALGVPALVLSGCSLGAVSAPASATDLKRFNKKLASVGLPEFADIPGGFNALLESYTQSTPKLFVEFLYPSAWLVVKPNQNTNGEAGTVSAGDYGKGDSAALYVGAAPKDGAAASKSFIEKTFVAGISQRGDNQYQNFEITKVLSPPAKDYVMAEFTYELLTGAGFVVERKGVGSLTTIGATAPALITVTTSARYKKLGPTLRTVAESFRAFEKSSSIADISSDD